MFEKRQARQKGINFRFLALALLLNHPKALILKAFQFCIIMQKKFIKASSVNILYLKASRPWGYFCAGNGCFTVHETWAGLSALEKKEAFFLILTSICLISCFFQKLRKSSSTSAASRPQDATTTLAWADGHFFNHWCVQFFDPPPCLPCFAITFCTYFLQTFLHIF